MISKFPHPQTANADGVVAIGGDLSSETLIDAYTHGIFPWPHQGMPLLWFSPWQRGIITAESFAISKRLAKYFKAVNWSITWNHCFSDVIKECSLVPRPGQVSGTWISAEIQDSYIELHKRGYAHSIEVWDQAHHLIGGLYGVFIGGVFSAESMFFKVANSSKAALAVLCVDQLLYREKIEADLHGPFVDVQMVTPVVASFGGIYVSQQDFLKLKRAYDARQDSDFGRVRKAFGEQPLLKLLNLVK